MTLKFDGWPQKTTGHLFYATLSFLHHFVAIGEFKLELQSGNVQSGSNLTLFRAVWPWNLTDDLQKQYTRKTTRLKSGWGFGQTNSLLSTAKVLIDAVGLCLLRVSEVWRLFAPDLRRRINSFPGSDFKPRLVYKLDIFVISSQTLTSSLRQSNCIHCDKKLSLYCHQNIFCSVAAKG